MESAVAKSLNYLDIFGTMMRLEGLKCCTALQHLSLDPCAAHPHGLSSKNASTLERDLHQLQRLTSLRLCGGYAKSSILDSISSLTSLLDLSLDRGYTYDPLTLPEGSLPVSLTHVDMMMSYPAPATLETVPALAQLTALKSLDLQRVEEFSAGLLSQLKRLQRCVIETWQRAPDTLEGLTAGAPVEPGGSPVRLAVLTIHLAPAPAAASTAPY